MSPPGSVKLDIAALEAAFAGEEQPAKRRRPKARSTEARARSGRRSGGSRDRAG